WEILIGVQAEHQWPPPESIAGLRTRVDESWTRLRNHVRIEHSHVTDDLIRRLRTAAGPALERESAIARALERHHARMAASLLQGGLFDRRAERETTAQ